MSKPRETIVIRPLVVGALTALVAALPMAAAVASPPTPLVTKIDDVARAQLSEGATVGTPVGTDSSSAVYTLAPGSGTGWRTAPGTSVFAVTEGVLTLQSAKGCTTKEYKVGQAAVVPPGRYLLANAGSEPLEFAGVFVNLTKGSAAPLVDGTGEPAPAGCKGASGYTAASTSGASVADSARGTMVPVAHYGKSVHALGAKGITVEAGKDVLVSYYSLLPGSAPAGPRTCPPSPSSPAARSPTTKTSAVGSARSPRSTPPVRPTPTSVASTWGPTRAPSRWTSPSSTSTSPTAATARSPWSVTRPTQSTSPPCPRPAALVSDRSRRTTGRDGQRHGCLRTRPAPRSTPVPWLRHPWTHRRHASQTSACGTPPWSAT